MLPLENKWIVVTRPKHQADNLRKKLEAAGAHVILFPLLEIRAPDNQSFVQQQLSELDSYDLVIFVSPNAVVQTLKRVSSAAFGSSKIAAIGKKTTKLLEEHGLNVNFSPKEIFNSEALLAVPGMRGFTSGSKVVILRADGGRDFLKDSLQKNGAHVDYVNVYKKYCPQNDLQLLAEHFNRNELDVILISSGNSLEYLFGFQSENTWLNEVSLLVGSERIKKQLADLTDYQGKLLSTQDPSDETFFQQLLKWAGEEQ